jgi:aminoglycoside N3'-acetyltransferase
MDELTKLQAQSDQLGAAIKSYIKYQRDMKSSDQLRANPEANKELNKAKTVIHASMVKIKALLGGPVDLIQDLARQVCIPTLSFQSHLL